jgi:hypothetical protein
VNLAIAMGGNGIELRQMTLKETIAGKYRHPRLSRVFK